MIWPFKKKQKTQPELKRIDDGYRVNRIIRSEWNAGNCKQINRFHHYHVLIDGRYHTYGIVEITSAIRALEEHERLNS